MRKINRRQFISKMTIGLSTIALSACKFSLLNQTQSNPSVTIIPTTENSDYINSAQLLTPTKEYSHNQSATSIPTLNNNNYPNIVVVRNGEPEALVETAFRAIGGIEHYIPQGSNVIIKPNICVSYHSYEYAATTNPYIVGAIVNLCIKSGAHSVRVMDFPFGGSAKEAYKISGIEDQVLAAGGEMVVMSNIKFITTDLPDGVDLKQCDIYDDILKADVIINVPIAKNHGLARLTLGIKNLMGVIRDRPSIHQNLGQRLADLSNRIRPTITVIDAVRMLMANGPTGGSLSDVKIANTIIVSSDIVAADSYAATLFGFRPEQIEYINASTNLGLGNSDLQNQIIEEINL